MLSNIEGAVMKKRPKVVVNVAMSADGKIALTKNIEVKISGEEDFERVHRLRNRVDAIIVGIGTVLADDPKLTVKEKYVADPVDPLRVVLDSQGRIPKYSNIFMDDNYLIATTQETDRENFVKCGDGDRVDVKALLESLYERGVREVLVEGGGEVIYSFFEAKAVDEFYVFVGSMIIGGSEAPTPADGTGAQIADDIIGLKLLSHEPMDDGVILKYEVKYHD